MHLLISTPMEKEQRPREKQEREKRKKIRRREGMIKAEDKALHVHTEGKRKEIAKWNASINQKETVTGKRDATLGRE